MYASVTLPGGGPALPSQGQLACRCPHLWRMTPAVESRADSSAVWPASSMLSHTWHGLSGR